MIERFRMMGHADAAASSRAIFQARGPSLLSITCVDRLMLWGMTHEQTPYSAQANQADPAGHVQPVLRFAPSPNGFLHLGHAYSALFNDRLARELGGMPMMTSDCI